MAGQQVAIADHQRLPWLVHDLAFDYQIEDIWRIPAELEADDSLADFWEQMQVAVDRLDRASPAAVLFRIRFALGRLFGWDDDPSDPTPLELRRRYTEQHPREPQAEAVGGFHLVYQLENEYLSEIENSTVQAALHLARTPADSFEISGINLAVYVKPKGRLGKAYMAAIRPFRHRIVYPAILNAAGRQWTTYKTAP